MSSLKCAFMQRESTAAQHGLRLRIVLIVLLLAALALAARAVELQLMDHEFLQTQGNERHMRVLPITAHRGTITDRYGEPLAVSIDNAGKVFLQNTEIPVDELVPKLMAISENGYNQRIFVRGDRTVDYGRVMEVMGMLNSAGFTRIGLVTESQRRMPEP